jgi:hypothetical protein
VKRLIKNLILIVIPIILLACGGGGSGQDGTGRPPTIERQVVSIGTITSQDSITVNGVEYDANEAEVTIDNETGSVDQLQLGQIVIVNGTLDEDRQTGTANTISRDTNIFGPVSLMNASEKTLEVLGQTIRITDDTLYRGDGLSEFSDIEVYDHLRVIGFVLANGDLLASYVEHVVLSGSQVPGEEGNPFYEVNGRIANLNIDGRIFDINGLVFDYSNINSLDELENGRTVEILGSNINTQDQFVATSIRSLPTELAELDVRVELEGFITVFRSIEDFEINGTLISTDEVTIYVGGTATQLDENRSLTSRQKLEIEGSINSDGVLLAERIIFLVAQLASHTSGDVLDSDTVTFSWTDVQADEYGFHMNSEDIELHEHYFNSEITSVTVNNLPVNGAELEIAIGTKRGERWFYQGFQLRSQSTLLNAELLNYASGDVLSSDSATFSWSDVSADEYRLLLFTGDRSGSVHDEYYFGEDTYGTIHDEYYSGATTSVTLDNLPVNGAEISLVLFTRHGQGWARKDYSIIGQNLLPNADLSSHTNGAVLSSSTATFSWLDVNADEYRVEFYSMSNLIHAQTYSNQTTSITLGNLPINGAALNFRLFTRHGAGWNYQNYNLTSHKTLNNAVLLSHTQNERLNSDVAIFSWSDVSADEYEVKLFLEGRLIREQRYNRQTTSVTFSDLPTNGEELTLGLFTRHGKGWAFKNYHLISSVSD